MFRYPGLSSDDKQAILRFLSMGGRCPNPNPQMGNIHRYLLQEEIQRTRLPNGQEIDSRNWFYLIIHVYFFMFILKTKSKSGIAIPIEL